MQKLFYNTIVLLSLLLAQVGAQYVHAPVIRDSQPVTYTATLLNKNTTGIRGTITGTGGEDGAGTTFTVDFTGFPDEETYGPFVYHIHQMPVPPNGDCEATLGHLDPYNRGETPPCDASEPDTCQVGDLSGKHGSIVAVLGEPFFDEYNDYYLSTTPGSPAYFGNLSVVVHSNNLTRLNCGNFQLDSSDSTAGTSAASGASAATPHAAKGKNSTATATATTSVSATTVKASPSPSIPLFDGAASTTRELSVGVALLAGALAAVFAFA